jgi:hypothetical protein
MVSAVFVFLLNGCAGTTPIKNLALPPVSRIEGHITQLDESGFTLMDNSGSIYVRAELPDNRKLNLSVDEKVKVYGNLQGGQKKIFDGDKRDVGSKTTYYADDSVLIIFRITISLFFGRSNSPLFSS